MIYADSFEEAYEKAEHEAKKSESSHTNPYGHLVHWVYVQPQDCFHLFDEEIKDKTEIYSRQYNLPKDTATDVVVRRFYPEADESLGQLADYF